jgi:ubiquinone/menaquinone biosynthesis C-methylase UbiE
MRAMDFLCSSPTPPKGATVLDLGCGTGRGSIKSSLCLAV